VAWCLLALIAVAADAGWVARSVQSPGADGMATELLRHFSYFTTLSNLLVAIIGLRLTMGGELGRVGRWLLLTALTCIAQTGLGHWFLLRPFASEADGGGLPAILDATQHLVVPIGTVLVWVLLGPRGAIRGRELPWLLLFPGVYILWCLYLGDITGWYPYWFVGVNILGWTQTLLTAGGVVIAIMILGLAAWGWDLLTLQLLARARSARSSSSLPPPEKTTPAF
jgi:hypothetical protein